MIYLKAYGEMLIKAAAILEILQYWVLHIVLSPELKVFAKFQQNRTEETDPNLTFKIWPKQTNKHCKINKSL